MSSKSSLKTFLKTIRETSADVDGNEGVNVYNICYSSTIMSMFHGVQEYEGSTKDFPLPIDTNIRKKRGSQKEFLRLTFDQDNIKDPDLLTECIVKQDSKDIKITEGKDNSLHVDIIPIDITNEIKEN